MTFIGCSELVVLGAWVRVFVKNPKPAVSAMAMPATAATSLPQRPRQRI